jgi:drug/metabolite transporter (DMT)-like permease
LSVLALALACTSFAYVLYFRLLARAGAINVSLVTFLVPVSAILLGATFLGEALAVRHYAGMALIFAGLAVIDGRAVSLLARKRM